MTTKASKETIIAERIENRRAHSGERVVIGKIEGGGVFFVRWYKGDVLLSDQRFHHLGSAEWIYGDLTDEENERAHAR